MQVPAKTGATGSAVARGTATGSRHQRENPAATRSSWRIIVNIANTLRLSLAAATLLAGVAAPPRAHAADRDERTIVITYADLNLARKQGVDALRHRLVMASRDVCGGSIHDMAVTADYEACRSDALQNALHDLRVAVAAANRGNYAVASATSH